MSTDPTNICQPNGEVESLLEAIRQRFSQLADGDCQRRVFLNRLGTLGSFDAEPMDYQEPDAAELPKELEIGFAVCHPECGNQAFVVIEGGPQGCDRCGGTMLPVKTGIYRLKKYRVDRESHGAEGDRAQTNFPDESYRHLMAAVSLRERDGAWA